MKAAVLREQKQPLVIEEVTLDDPGPGQVLVKTAAAGVCHSDLHFIEGLWPIPTPVVLGHEAAGVVEAAGPGVTYVEPGDHVILLFVPFCGSCRYCTTGRPNLCPEGRTWGQTVHIGDQAVAPFLSMSSFAEYMVVPQNGLVKIRKDVPLDRAALVGCGVMTGIGAVINTAKVEPGSKCVVIGTGGVGLNVIQGCALAGAERIIAVDINPNKLEMAREFGATHFVDASKEDPIAKVKELTDGGPEYAFEVIGLPQAATQAFDMVRPGGEAIVVGMMPMGSEITVSGPAFLAEKVLRGCVYGSARPRYDMPRILDLYMAGKLKLDELVSRTYPLDGINDAFDAMKNGEVARSVIAF
ncbi:MAG: Zn-dependent alcohol dehydrogenase [Dehalococcoidia bacterium]|nr:Zn-dependent alcohol dehydrogenase [Dehalococcoidia bacterium]